MKRSNSEIFNEIITAAIEIAAQHGIVVKGDKAAERLALAVSSFATQKRRESEFFDSMRKDGNDVNEV